jgi:PKD repeat protein
VQFTDTSSGAVTAWAWERGDGTRSTSANPSHVYTSSGGYTVRLTVTGPGGSDSETQTNLILVAPPLVITGVTPSEIDLLIPGTAETVSITGTSFTPSTVVEVDGAPVDAGSFTVVHDGLITLDMPQVALGTRTLTVRDGTDSDDADVTVVLPATPKLQVGNGDPLNVLSSATGASLAVAGRPGTVHYVLYSTSNVPSTAAIVSLAIGNSFSELFIGTVESIPASGIVRLAGPLVVPVEIDVYVQSVVFGLGRPLPVSNMQSVHFEP